MTSPSGRKPLSTVFGVTLLAFVFACTNDYDEFEFNGGSPAEGGGTTVQNGGGGNPPTNGGNPPTDGGGGMATTDGGSTNEGGGGSPPVGDLPCGDGGLCAQACCIDEDGASDGTCEPSCGSNEGELRCDEPSDCPGQVCCLHIASGNGDIEDSTCSDSCTGNDLTICSDSGDCDGNNCDPNNDLPDGYNTCPAQ